MRVAIDREPPALVPQPRDVRWTGGEIRIGRLAITSLPESIAAHREQIETLAGLVTGAPTHPHTPVHFAVRDAEPEGYELRTNAHGVGISAGDSLGALHAMRTLVALWDHSGGSTLPEVEIADHPTFPVRGVFAESFAGTDRMELSDWQRFLDRMGQLKFNTVGVSIYGCWDIHHEGARSEYLFTPLREFPELTSPQRMVTWDPATGGETEFRYLPKMFEHDFFGEVARYAAQQGIELVPHLGGPGHSTLIPRLVPELSALDERGEPTGYGYCVSRPAARDALARLVRCLARQHLVPSRIRRLHVAADEYYPIRNVDPRDRKRTVSPYCRCAGCAALTPGQMLIEYLLQVGEVLAPEGVTMVHWQDTLVREGVLDEYLDRIEAADLPRPTIAWWKYNDPVPTPDASRTETWSCPTTGLAAFLFHQDFSPNIEMAVRRGHRAGATGAFAYTLPDPADHMNYAFLADMAWNLEASDGAAAFPQRWARYICDKPDDVTAARHALTVASNITSCYPLMMYVVQHVLPFFATATAGATYYPDDVLRSFAVVQPPLVDVLRQTADTLREAVALMPAGRDVRYWPNPITTWRQENTRLIDSLDLFLEVLAAARQPEPVTEDQLVELARESNALLRFTADSKPDYLVPATLREHWGFIREIGPTLRRLREGDGVAAAESWYAWIV